MTELAKKLVGQDRSKLIVFTIKRNLTGYTFTGRYTAALVELLGREPTVEEIIECVDGSPVRRTTVCTINRAARTFHGRI